MKIKANISSIEIRMHRKMQKFALRTLKMSENHSIRIRTSIFYFSEYQNETFDENFIQWDENEKRHASQINRILNIMTCYVNQISNIENIQIWIKSWKEMNHWPELKNNQIENSSMENSSNKADKKLRIKTQIENHADLLKSIFKKKNSMIFYIDEAKNTETTDAEMILYFNAERKAENWNSGKNIDVIDAELFAIEKSIELCANKSFSIKTASDIWIFTDSANAITRLKKLEFRTHVMQKIHKNCKMLYEMNYKIHIH